MPQLPRFLFPLVLTGSALVALFQFGHEARGCACGSPPSQFELGQTIAIANGDDKAKAIVATGLVYYGYLDRGELEEASRWKRRAIAAGDPHVLSNDAGDILVSIVDISDRQQKHAKLRQAIDLLDRAKDHRDLLDDIGRSAYVKELREARGALLAMQVGLATLEAKAKRGDATAAHDLAAYYFRVELDQDKRSYWSLRAARLGDPGLAYDYACCLHEKMADLTDGKKVIQAAWANRRAWENSGDQWVQATLAKDLKKVEFKIDRRIAMITGS